MAKSLEFAFKDDGGFKNMPINSLILLPLQGSPNPRPFACGLYLVIYF